MRSPDLQAHWVGCDFHCGGGLKTLEEMGAAE
jgi:hypothetical protein